MKMTHPNCADHECKVCLADAEKLGALLEEQMGDLCDDHLGEYYNWLKEHGIAPETAHGWLSEAAFDDDNINAFIAGGRPKGAEITENNREKDIT